MVLLVCGVELVCAFDLINREMLQALVGVMNAIADRAALLVRAGEDGSFPEEVSTVVAAVLCVGLAVPVVDATGFTIDESGEPLSHPDSIALANTFAEASGSEERGSTPLESP